MLTSLESSYQLAFTNSSSHKQLLQLRNDIATYTSEHPRTRYSASINCFPDTTATVATADRLPPRVKSGTKLKRAEHLPGRQIWIQNYRFNTGMIEAMPIVRFWVWCGGMSLRSGAGSCQHLQETFQRYIEIDRYNVKVDSGDSWWYPIE